MERKPQRPRVPESLVRQINSIDVLFEDHVEDLKTFVEATAHRQRGAGNVTLGVYHYALIKLGYNAELFEQHSWEMMPSYESYPNEKTQIIPDFGNDPPEIAHFRIKTFICGLLGYVRDDLSSSKESFEGLYLNSYIQGRETRARVLERMCFETLESDSESIELTLLVHTYCMEEGYDVPFPHKIIFVRDMFNGKKVRREVSDFTEDLCFVAWTDGLLEEPSRVDDILGKFGYTPSQEYAKSYEKGVEFRKRILEKN